MTLPNSLKREDRLILLGALTAISYNKGVRMRPDSVSVVFKKIYGPEHRAEDIEIDLALLDLAGAVTMADPFLLSELIEDYIDGRDFRG